MARKSKINEKMVNDVYEYAKSGFNAKMIYEAIGLSHTAFYRNVSLVASLKRGQMELRQEISKSILSNAVDTQNPTVQIYLSKKLRLFDDTFNSMTLKKSDDVLLATSNLFKAVSDGSVSEDKSNQLLSILNTFTKAYEVNELEQRLTALENGSN